MDPVPDFGEQSYRGSGKLKGKVNKTTPSEIFEMPPSTK